jgi:hypothetical protein
MVGSQLVNNYAQAGLPPISSTNSAITILPGEKIRCNTASASQFGCLSAADFTTFSNKLDASRFNYVTNSDAEADTSDWNTYDDSGRTTSAFYLEQDITWTAVASGNGGNGVNIQYIFHATQSSSTPLVTVVNPNLITIAWYNGPTLANNPTATQLKAAFDAVPAAVAIATCTITGTASDRQYITGSHVLAEGGDTAPVNGTGGTSGLTFTRSTSSPLVESASFLLSKPASDKIGSGVSTDFTINAADKGNPLQVSFYYSGSGVTLGSASDVRVFLYDVTNAAMIPLSRKTLTGPTDSTTYRYAANFTASSSSVNYRLILHNSTTNSSTWDLKLDEVTINSSLDASAATEVPSLVLPSQPISGAVTSGMAVAWTDGASQWVPATNVFNGDQWGAFGMAGNIVGSLADITVRGKFTENQSFGPFAGYNQYVSTTAGSLTPIYPAANNYLIMGKAIASDTLLVNPYVGFANNPTKGQLLVGTGTAGDANLTVGANGNVLIANSAQTTGLQWAPAVVAAAPFTYTLATRTLTVATATDSVAGVMSAADHTTFTGHAPKATPTFTGDVNSSTGNVLVSTIGKGVSIKTGTNARIGTATLVGGTVTVNNTSITANTRIFLTSNVDGGTPGWLRVSAKTNATSFVITSSSGTDTSTVAWYLVESIP